jgi:hypothetical protein
MEEISTLFKPLYERAGDISILYKHDDLQLYKLTNTRKIVRKLGNELFRGTESSYHHGAIDFSTPHASNCFPKCYPLCISSAV